MKNKLLYIPCCLLLIATVGCNKFLDKEPDNRAKINTPEKVSQLLSTAYPQGNYQAFAETMSDNVEDIGNGGADGLINDVYYYRDTKENQQDSPESFWYACYSSIAAANQALETISKVSNPDDYKNQKGEALVARAFAHFQLVNFFAKFYDAATAATDPGIPYVTVPENVVIKQYDRKSVQYVYDMIEQDLLAGMPLIEDKAYNVPKFHFNVAAAAAFATRFYLFKKDYPKVIQYAGLAIPSGNYASFLRGINDPTSAYNTITDVTELFKVYSRTSESSNLLLVETASVWSRNYYSQRWGVGVLKAAEVYPRTDQLTGGVTAYKRYSISSGTHQLMPKIDEYFVRETVDANFGQPYVMVPLFAAEEVLFSHAEALYYTGNTAGAVALLNTFASKRISSYNATTHNITETKVTTVFPVVAGETSSKKLPSVIQAILYYKRMDYVHEGLRWFDVLRYKLPVDHNIKKGGSTPDDHIILSPEDPRKVLQLPQSSIQAGLAQNPR